MIAVAGSFYWLGPLAGSFAAAFALLAAGAVVWVAFDPRARRNRRRRAAANRRRHP